jgi:hypothetical protein
VVGAVAHLFTSLLSFFGNQRRRIAMIGSHKASLCRDVVGIALCALVGACALTKAPVSVTEPVSEEPITLAVRQIPVTKLVTMIGEAYGPGKVVTGVEQLGDTTATVQMRGVSAREALQSILNCTGFTYRETERALAIVRLEAPQQAVDACASTGMKLE